MKKYFLAICFSLVGMLFWPLISCADTLQQAVVKTLQTNPEILAKIKSWLASQESVNKAKGGYYPSVDVNANVGEDRNKNNNTNFQYDTLTTSGVGITLRQLVFDGFLTSSEVKRNQSHSEAEKYKVQATANDTALLASKAYLDVLTSKQIVGFAQENYQNHEHIFSMIQRRAESGISRKADMTQAAGRLALAKTNLLAAQNNYMDAQATYFKIVGVMPDNLTFPEDPSNKALPMNQQIAIKNATNNHPLLKSADADIAEAQAQHESAKAANYPRLDAVLHASTDENLAGVNGNYGNQSAILQLSYNIFNGGSDLAHQKETAYFTEQATQVRQNTYTQVVENMNLSWNALTTSESQLTYYKQHRDNSLATVDAYNQQFQLNKRTLLDLLNAEDEAFQAKVDYAKDNANIIFSKFRVLNGEGQLLSYLKIPTVDEKSQTLTPIVKTNSAETTYSKPNIILTPTQPKVTVAQPTTQTSAKPTITVASSTAQVTPAPAKLSTNNGAVTTQNIPKYTVPPLPQVTKTNVASTTATNVINAQNISKPAVATPVVTANVSPQINSTSASSTKPTVATTQPTTPPQTALSTTSTTSVAPQTTSQPNYSVATKPIAPKAIDNYTIVLYSTKDKNDAINFVVKNNLQGQGAFYQAKGEQPKFVVIYGTYNSKKNALKAIKGLPKSLRASNPNIKLLSVVQAEIAN